MRGWSAVVGSVVESLGGGSGVRGRGSYGTWAMAVSGSPEPQHSYKFFLNLINNLEYWFAGPNVCTDCWLLTGSSTSGTSPAPFPPPRPFHPSTMMPRTGWSWSSCPRPTMSHRWPPKFLEMRYQTCQIGLGFFLTSHYTHKQWKDQWKLQLMHQSLLGTLIQDIAIFLSGISKKLYLIFYITFFLKFAYLYRAPESQSGYLF